MDRGNILIVEDEEITRETLKKRLQKRGYKIFTLSNANDIMITIENHQIDLILLDIMLPDINGIEVLINIRNKFTTRILPIIMMTSKSEAPDIVEAFGHGANDYITKPYDITIICARIDTHLEMAHFSKKSPSNQNLDLIFNKIENDFIDLKNIDKDNKILSKRVDDLMESFDELKEKLK